MRPIAHRLGLTRSLLEAGLPARLALAAAVVAIAWLGLLWSLAPL